MNRLGLYSLMLSLFTLGCKKQTGEVVISKGEEFKVKVEELEQRKSWIRINDTISIFGGYRCISCEDYYPNYLYEYYENNNLYHFYDTILPSNVKLFAMGNKRFTIHKEAGENILKVYYQLDTIKFKIHHEKFSYIRLNK